MDEATVCVLEVHLQGARLELPLALGGQGGEQITLGVDGLLACRHLDNGQLLEVIGILVEGFLHLGVVRIVGAAELAFCFQQTFAGSYDPCDAGLLAVRVDERFGIRKVAWVPVKGRISESEFEW